MREMETRILKINVDEIRSILKDIGATRVKDENQINDLYDFDNGSMLKAKGYARIRTVEDNINNQTHYYMTTKKMSSQEKYKLMDEHEVEISDSTEGALIYNALGLKLVNSIKKHRESFKYKNSLVEIDINDKSFCPFPYIEIESCYEDEIHELVKLLGYTMEDTTSKTIFEILKDEGIIK